MKKLTIITITYNCEDLIETTIESVLNQKNEQIEYIIIDGKSKDRTNDIIKKYSNRIDKYVSEKDNGISDAFNKGINLATGEWIGLLNAGDTLIDNALYKLSQHFSSNADVLFANGIRLYKDGKYKPWFANPNPESLHSGMSMVHPSVFVKKSAYLKYGLFNTKYRCVMDRELLLRFLNQGCKFEYINDFISIYLMGGVSDQKYYSVVLKEEFLIDTDDGMPYIRRLSKYVKCCLINLLVNIRNKLGLNKSYDTLEAALEKKRI